MHWCRFETLSKIKAGPMPSLQIKTSRKMPKMRKEKAVMEMKLTKYVKKKNKKRGNAKKKKK